MYIVSIYKLKVRYFMVLYGVIECIGFFRIIYIDYGLFL